MPKIAVKYQNTKLLGFKFFQFENIKLKIELNLLSRRTQLNIHFLNYKVNDL